MSASPVQSHRSSIVSVRSISSLPEGTMVTFHPSSSSDYSSPLRQDAPVRKARVSFPSSAAAEATRAGPQTDSGLRNERAPDRKLAGGRTLSAPTTPSKSSLKPCKSPLRELRAATEDQNRARKRWNVMREIVVSEKSFKSGLDVIEEVFLIPLAGAALRPKPPLSSEELQRTFTSLSDLARLSKDLLVALQSAVDASATCHPPSEALPARPSPQVEYHFVQVLCTHLPFLAMYNTFVSAFPATSTFLRSRRQSSGSFRTILAEAESHPRAAKLRLEDWLLTVVQRVPRWGLLLRDLLSVTDVDSDVYDLLKRLVVKVDNIATSLNQRFHEQTATQELVALQRSFVSLPEPIIKPGRKLLKYGNLQKVGTRGVETRKFWLFNDMLLLGSDNSLLPTADVLRRIASAGWRSQSDPVPTKASLQQGSGATSRRASFSQMQESATEPSEGLYRFQQKIDLEDITVTKASNVRAGVFGDCSFQVLSPVESFEVVAASEGDRDEWLEAFRQAKDTLLADLGTLDTSKEHTLRKHRRRSLHAAPSLPDVFEQSSDIKASPCFYRERASSASSYLQPGPPVSSEDSYHTDATVPAVEHENYVAAVWLPDDSTEKCMCCGDAFTLWRRRHHCRLCGVVCCHMCTTRSCIINDSHNPSTATSLVRTCDTCFDSIFNPSSRHSNTNEGLKTVIRDLDYATIKNMPPSRPISTVSFAGSQDGSVESSYMPVSPVKGDVWKSFLQPTRTVTFEAVDDGAGDLDRQVSRHPRFAQRTLESLVEQTPSPASPAEISKGKAVESLRCIVNSYSATR